MSNNAFIKGITEGVIKNLPTILIVTSIGTGISTVAYSTWAGWRIKEITEDEAIDNKTKVKKIAVMSIPIVAGTTLASGCAIAAHKENSKRLAVLAASAAGAATLVNEDTKEKVLDLVDKNHKIHRSEKKNEKANISVSTDELIEVYDNNTGYKFKTTLADLWFTVNKFNDELTQMVGTDDKLTMYDFYRRLLGDSYDCLPAHELVKFGTDLSYGLGRGTYSGTVDTDKTVILSINLGSMLDDNMKLIYTMDYDYIE